MPTRHIVKRGVFDSLHDNARLHVAAAIREMIESFGWEVFDQPRYSPNLSSGDYHLFTKLKEFLDSDKELKSTVKTWRQISIRREF